MAKQVFESDAPGTLDKMLCRALLVQRAADTSEQISNRLAAVATELRKSARQHDGQGATMLQLASDFDRFAAEGRTSCFSTNS